jgi:GR25 family glycosyltransferase involved in LPS biosynthesis
MGNLTYIFNDNKVLSGRIEDGRLKELTYYTKEINHDNIIFRNDKVNLFYNFYIPKEEERKMELNYCFNKFLENKLIDNLYVLCTDELKLEDDKIIKIKINHQPKYRDFFNIIDFFSNENDINIILNSDCYIDEHNLKLIKKYLQRNQAFLLSRWDILSIKPFEIEHFDKVNKDNSGCSQDAWIFKGKPKCGLIGDYELGRAGCDNAIAHEFNKSGYIVSNPSFTIKVYHYHLSKIRTYGDYILEKVDNREKFRVKSSYHFIPSSRIIFNMDVVFYNHYHNGDIHYSREFIKDIMKKYKSDNFYYYFNLDHVCSKDIIKDCNIKYIDKLPQDISEKDFIKIINDTIYINTWIGQNDYNLVKKHGINLNGNYQLYKKVYKELNIDIEDNMEYYIPTIDYSYYDIQKIDKFLKGKEKIIKVLISNGITKSAQVENFDTNDAIDGISSLYKDIMFILTDSSNRIDKKNIIYTDDIINKKCDLNEISYLSKFCDVIIGRASGPYAFSHIKENLLNPGKYFLCFVNKPEYEWYISKECEHIVTDKYRKIEIISQISEGIEYTIENKNKKIVKRIAFTILFNGLHHLKHKNYTEFLAKNFDYWVVVEGASKNKGSTSWCKEMPSSYHKNGKSIDGTVDFMKKLCKKYDNIIFIESNGMWESKDDMVNRAIDEVKKITNSCFLWQVDVDEQWTVEQIIKSEKELKAKKCKTGKFNVFQFVGEGLIAFGKDWAGAPFTRLWDWKGEKFISHEPPALNTTDKSETILSERMMHYAFYFEEDVKFKNDWYNDHDDSLKRWKKLKTEKKFPQHITYLFPKFKGSKYLINSNNLDCHIVKYRGDIQYNIFNNLVDKSYCINIERRKDRLDHIKKELEKININYKIFKGMDGQELKLKKTSIEKGMIGAIRSHTGVIKDAIENKYETIAVFEDDISFCEDFDERFKIYLRDVPDDWEIMYLGCHFNSCELPKQIKNNIHRVNCCYGCFAMILNNKRGLFQKILDNVTEDTPYDNFINSLLPNINAYVFMPFFVKTIETKSDISERTDSFSYDVVNQYFQERLIIENSKLEQKTKVEQTITRPVKPSSPPPPPPPPMVEYVKSNQEICEDFVKSGVPFQVYHMGRLIFDSSNADKINLYFYNDHFTLYGRTFSYQGMAIKIK